jgi:diguanylate cyclase
LDNARQLAHGSAAMKPVSTTREAITASKMRRFARMAQTILSAAALIVIAAVSAPATALHGEATPLKLTDETTAVSAWPHVRILYDESKAMSVSEALGALPKFQVHAAQYATLGVRNEAAWIHIPIEVVASNDDWVVDIDYPPLNIVDVYLTQNARVLSKFELGSLRRFETRPLLARSHAAPFELVKGERYDLLIRVETRGAMILPIIIERPSAFHDTGIREQLLQGLLFGIALCLVLYSLGQYTNTRERLFLKYSLLVIGSGTFALLQLGIGAQYVWTNNLWIERHVAGLASMMAIAGTFLFLEEALREGTPASETTTPWFTYVMKGGAAVCAVLAILHATDVLSLRAMSFVVTIMGPLPSLIATPKFIQRARRGDPVGWYLLLAFTVYMIAVIVITAVIRGKLPVNFWTLHSFQFGATLDMLAFLYVLTLRTKAIRIAAMHASRERDIMRALAHTDPLTGLANRRSLSDGLAATLTHCSTDNMLAVYVIDLDNFKPVNDTYGHDIGDELLVAASQRLQGSVRNGDIVSRLGGDEFVILASGLRNEQQAEQIGANLLDAFNAPFKLGSHTVTVRLTIGYAIAPIHGRDSMSILKLADDAMYLGKQSGKACLRRTMG